MLEMLKLLEQIKMLKRVVAVTGANASRSGKSFTAAFAVAKSTKRMLSRSLGQSYSKATEILLRLGEDAYRILISTLILILLKCHVGERICVYCELLNDNYFSVSLTICSN